MIHYALRCDGGHEFDGWFQGSAGFERERRAGRLACPVCESVEVERAIMAPAVSRGAGAASAETATVTAPASGEGERRQVSLGRGDLEVLRRMRRMVEENCEHVGGRFAEEARRMHDGESDARGIYGESTPEELRALDEEGIEYGSVPWVSKNDS
ncbi:MAG: DUF1178 family protein [Alphaproteobacteria bacterium]|nr:DUF1178 family protein [Alphaproteobacteria bacterium]MDA7987668.1 DUF1178 family protein [Alphaproteobacteria bacterium]